ncbi:hypothetical protein M569_14205, partial [Genlisea aurea]
ENYWRRVGDRSTVTIPGWKFISYFSDVGNICWFLEPEFAAAITRLHRLVGNAVTADRHIVVGTGSSQLIQAALYAVVSPDPPPTPVPVVSAAPYYSSYPLIVDLLKSRLYGWGGCAREFQDDGEAFVELVTYPNNPDGAMRKSVVNGSRGILIHDLAYYWPQYVPIVSPADHDVMLFTVSKSTGHAGTRLGWAVVKDPEIARKMTEFIILNTIGVSKDSQHRAAKIIQVICDTHERRSDFRGVDPFFDHSFNSMARRWRQLRNAVEDSNLFTLPEFPRATCTFSGRSFSTQPAFAWVKCEAKNVDNCERFLKQNKILTRSGKHFGESEKYVRISVLPSDQVFEQFVERLPAI